MAPPTALLTPASRRFRPNAQIAKLRAYLRQRERLVEYAAAHIQPMQKALMEINLQLHHVVSDITGVTGMKMIRAIVAGERDPDVLACLRDIRCHSSAETIRASLVGNDPDEHIFALSQSVDLYDFYQPKMLECDPKLKQAIAAMSHNVEKPQTPLPRIRTRTKQPNTPSFDVRAALYGLVGADLTQIHGLGSSLALKLIGECGTDLRAWPTANHFTSLAPGNKICGGRLLLSRTRRSSSRAAALLRLVATTTGRSQTALGAFTDVWQAYRKAESRDGDGTQDRCTLFQCLRFGKAYRDPRAAAYDERRCGRVFANLQRRARSLGYQLDPIPDAESVSYESGRVFRQVCKVKYAFIAQHL